MSIVYDHDAGALSALDRAAISHIPEGGNWRHLPSDFPSERVKQIRAGAEAGGGTRSTYYGRLRWDTTAATIATYFVRPGNGANIHPRAPRTLTFREASRLQGFPDSVRFFGSRRSRAVQIGNAVPPPLAATIADALPERGFAVELFAGAGGLAAGCHAAGFPVVAAADLDRDALATLGGHLRLENDITPRCLDLSELEASRHLVGEVRASVGAEGVSLLAGGPPCQGFSTAGNNLLEADSRNYLPDVFLWFVEELQPRQVIFENVAALTWSSRRRWFDAILLRLLRLRYSVEWRLIHCEGYGLPQRRRRVIIVARRHGLGDFIFPAARYSIEDPRYADIAQSLSSRPIAPPTVRDAIGDLPEAPAPLADSPVATVADGNDSAYRRYVTGQLPLLDYVRSTERVEALG